MLTEELNYALEKGLIDKNTERLIKEYDERLTQNNVPIIYNLRHLRKILNIKKSEQNLLFGNNRQD